MTQNIAQHHYCTVKWYVTSETKVLVAVVVISRLDPLDVNSCFPGGRGLRNTQFPSDTAFVVPDGAPKILSSGNVALNSGETTRLFSSPSNLVPSNTNSKCCVLS